jgi:hypothetical protein
MAHSEESTNDLTTTTSEPVVSAFCSYVHLDNEVFGRVVERLVTDVCLLYEAETGRTLDFFRDRTSIGWGENLRDAVGDSVENASFFVPIITARYFRSDWCRNEILSFYGKSNSLGVTELILPIILAGKSMIKEDSPDEVVRIVARVNYVDWSEVWQSERGSEQWSLAVTDLTQRLVELHSTVEERLLTRALRGPAATWDGSSLTKPSSPRSKRTAGEDHVEIIRATATEAFTTIDALVQALTSFITDLQDQLAAAVVADPVRSRLALDQLGAELLSRGHDLDSRARQILETLVEMDADLRTMVRTVRALGSAEVARQLNSLMDDLRRPAQKLSLQIRQVNALSVALNRFGDNSIGLRAALSPVRAALQSIRDMAHILDGWISMELPRPR